LSYGWAGTILHINVTNGKVLKEPTEKYARHFLGGRGINARILYEETKPSTSSLEPDNPLVFGMGPLGGTGVFCASRTEITSKSPVHVPELLGLGGFGGFWGSELKFAGYDNLVVQGKAEKPAYVWIDNESVELRNASSLWGLDTFETQTRLEEELGDPDVQVVCIGPAGEKLVRISTISHGIEHAAGNGMGAVMGAKNLKAIAVRGSLGIQLAHPDKFMEANDELYKRILESPAYERWSKDGSSATIRKHYADRTIFLVGNSESDYWSIAPKLGEEALRFVERYAVKMFGCMSCPAHCTHYLTVPGVGGGAITCTPWPGFTGRVWNTDLKVMFEANQLCHRYGLDSLRTSAIIALLMELYTKGVTTAEDTDGIAMERGSREAILTTIHKIAKREGFGNTFAEGLQRGAKSFGKGAEEYVVEERGATYFHDMRAFPGFALSAAVSTRGDYIKSGEYEIEKSYDSGGKFAEEAKAFAKEMFGTEKAAIPGESEGKGTGVAFFMDMSSICDLLGICNNFTPDTVDKKTPLRLPAALFSAATGVEMTEKELLTAAERVITLERAFLVREGISRKDDVVPRKFFKESIPDGMYKGKVLDRRMFEKMKDDYYKVRKWDAEGIPTRERLEELDLRDVADELTRLGKIQAPRAISL
jgi:aldehyde:ferredoxin oxidoreductase